MVRSEGHLMAQRHKDYKRAATITPFGAAGEVTGSCYLLDTGAARLLLECGLLQGGRDADTRNAAPWPFELATIDAVVLSHAHLDHSGLVPRLVKDGYSGPVYATSASCQLLKIMWQDAAHLNERDVEWENKWRRRAGKKLLEPLYGIDDAQAALALLEPIDYDAAFVATHGISVRYHDAGHILGSAIVALDIEHDNGHTRLVFSGDLGNSDTVLLRDPTPIQDADILLLESTYGDRNHRTLAETHNELGDVLAAAHADGGNVLIPAFAIGRTQELLYTLGLLEREGRLPQAQVFLDSPMAIAATHTYERNTELFNEHDRERLRGESLAKWLPALRYSETTEESLAINRISGGAVIIAGSGMCTGGRIRHHLKYNLWRREAHLVFCGFQAAHTLGRALVDGAKRVKLLGNQIAVKANIHTLGGFSAHAGQNELVRWASAFRPRPRVWLVHGEVEARDALADRLRTQLKLKAKLAKPGDAIAL
jgi:metallo-beta-lactamase family protein